LARFEAEGESFLSWIIIADGTIILNRIQKGNPWKSTVFNLLGGGGGTVNSDVYIRTLKELGSVSNDFGITGIQKKSCFSKDAHKF
jgi:hypothetical protein